MRKNNSPNSETSTQAGIQNQNQQKIQQNLSIFSGSKVYPNGISQINDETKNGFDFTSPRDQISVNDKLINKFNNESIEISNIQNQGGFTNRQRQGSNDLRNNNSNLVSENVLTPRTPRSGQFANSKKRSYQMSVQQSEQIQYNFTLGDSQKHLSGVYRNTKYKTLAQMPFWKFMSIVTKISKFINNSINSIESKKKFEELTDQQLQLINDLSFERRRKDHQNSKKIRITPKYILNTMTDHFIALMSCMPLILPNHRFKIIADCWQSFLVIYRIFITTIKMSFFLFDQRGSLDLVDTNLLIIINSSFIFDIILSFNTGYYEKGIIIFDRRKIALNYFQKTFITDIFAQIPLIVAYFVNNESSDTLVFISYFCEFLIFMKWFSLKNVFTRLERVITENESIAAWFPLVSLLVNVLMIAHVVGLLWNLCAIIEINVYDEQETWLHTQPADQYYTYLDTHWLSVYIATFYWAVCTMVTILLYIPNTNIEIIFSVLAMFVCAGCFGYALNTIGNILDDINKKNSQFKAERVRINRFIKKNNISPNLKERIQLYIDYLHEQEKEKDQEEEDQVIKRLSEHLKREILIEMYKDVITKFTLLQQNFSEETIHESMLNIKLETYSPGAIIIQQDEYEKSQKEGFPLYYLERGEVQIVVQRNKKQHVFQTLRSGNLFGVVDFFTGSESPVTYQCTQSCSIYKIKRTDFLNIIEGDKQDDYEMFMMIKNDMMILRESQVYNYQDPDRTVKCNICDNQSHQSINCPKVQNIPNLKKIIYDYNHLGTQLRQKYDRCEFKERKFNALENMRYVQEDVIDIFEGEDDLAEEAIQWREFYLSLNDEEGENEAMNMSTSSRMNRSNRNSFQFQIDKKKKKTSIDQSQELTQFQELKQDINIQEKQEISEVEENSSCSSSSQSNTVSNSSSYITDEEINDKNNTNDKKTLNLPTISKQSLNSQNKLKQMQSIYQEDDMEEEEDEDDQEEDIEIASSMDISKSQQNSKINGGLFNSNQSKSKNFVQTKEKNSFFLDSKKSYGQNSNKNDNSNDISISLANSQTAKQPMLKINLLSAGELDNTAQFGSKRTLPAGGRQTQVHSVLPQNFMKQHDSSKNLDGQEDSFNLVSNSTFNEIDSPHFSKPGIISPFKKKSEKRQQEQKLEKKTELKPIQVQEPSLQQSQQLSSSKISTQQKIDSSRSISPKKIQTASKLDEETRLMRRQSRQLSRGSKININPQQLQNLGKINMAASSVGYNDQFNSLKRKKSVLYKFQENYQQPSNSTISSQKQISFGMNNNNNQIQPRRSSVLFQLNSDQIRPQKQSLTMNKNTDMGASIQRQFAPSIQRRQSIKQQNQAMYGSSMQNSIKMKNQFNFQKQSIHDLDLDQIKTKTPSHQYISNQDAISPGMLMNPLQNTLQHQQTQQLMQGNTPINQKLEIAQQILEEGAAHASQDDQNWFEWDLLNFDKMKEYLIFYPKNNMTVVLEDMPQPRIIKKEVQQPNKRERKIKQSLSRMLEIKESITEKKKKSNNHIEVPQKGKTKRSQFSLSQQGSNIINQGSSEDIMPSNSVQKQSSFNPDSEDYKDPIICNNSIN